MRVRCVPRLRWIPEHGEQMKVCLAHRCLYLEARADAIKAFVTQLRVEMVPLSLRQARARVANQTADRPREAASGSHPLPPIGEASGGSSDKSSTAGSRVALTGGRHYG